MTAHTVSCGVVLANRRGDVFVCHTTGTARWDLPKGMADDGEAPRDAAVREAWEEAGLRLPAGALVDLGEFDYLPAKRLHLFALRVADDAIDVSRCRCRSFFPHHRTGCAHARDRRLGLEAARRPGRVVRQEHDRACSARSTGPRSTRCPRSRASRSTARPKPSRTAC